MIYKSVSLFEEQYESMKAEFVTIESFTRQSAAWRIRSLLKTMFTKQRWHIGNLSVMSRLPQALHNARSAPCESRKWVASCAIRPRGNPAALASPYVLHCQSTRFVLPVCIVRIAGPRDSHCWSLRFCQSELFPVFHFSILITFLGQTISWPLWIILNASSSMVFVSKVSLLLNPLGLNFLSAPH